MRRPLFRHNPLKIMFAVMALAPCLSSSQAAAQSSDISFPAPVFSNEIAARIPPRDLGDSRQTRHFYAFNGTEGDLTVTIESSELNGDVDVFVAKTLRPLLKVTLFGGTATKATKSFYLRKEETLLLRVEARAVGDTEGSYRILLGGSFAPAAPGLAQTPETALPEPSETTPRSGTRRVTATGARIEEPRGEVAEAMPTPTPEAKAAEDSATTEAKPTPTREARSRRGRNSRGATNRTGRPAPAASPAETKESAETATNKTSEALKPEAEKSESVMPSLSVKTPSRTPRRRGARAANRPAPVPKPSADTADSSSAEPPTAPTPVVTILRLVIVTKDGQTLERDMTTVRRVTVEKDQIVVALKDGKVIRTPLAMVAKMSFEP